MKDEDGWTTDLSPADMEEAPAPKLPVGITSTESFGCIEMLGVLPPPEKGWLKKSAGGKVAYLANKLATDWIYNVTEEKYYHAPSKSWWEKRRLESADPKVPPYTYVRTDARHLETLANFAASLDSGALPLAWKSWTLYVRKKKAAVQIAAAPVVEEVPHDEDAGAAAPAEEPRLEPVVEEKKGPSAADTAAIIAAIQSEVEVDEEDEEEEQAEEEEEEESTPKPTKPQAKAKKRGCCFCFGARAKDLVSESASEEEEEEEAAPLLDPPISKTGPASKPPPSERTASTVTGSGSQDPAVTDTSRTVGVESPGKKEEAPRISPADELQTRRLQLFLSDIGRNPQRLVTHVERRRADRTAASFM